MPSNNPIHVEEKTIHRAIIKAIFRKGNYVLCILAADDPSKPGAEVTFNLSNWTSKMLPKKGQIALLQGIERFENGWRAQVASPEKLK